MKKVVYLFILSFFSVHSINMKPFYNKTIHYTHKKTIKLRNFLKSNLDVLYL